MNKTYKTVWNQATRTWAVASELAKSKTKSAGGKAASTVASATMLVASMTGVATMAAPLRVSAAEQAVFNDGTSNACTAINSDGTTSALTGTAACATTIGSGTASAAGLGSGLNFASNANGAFINGGLEVFGTGVAAGSPAAYIHGQLSLFSGPGTTGAANRIVGVAAGSAATDAVNVQQLTNATRYFKAGGANNGTDDATTFGSGIAVGSAANSLSNYGVALGVKSTASGNSTIAIGRNALSTQDSGLALGVNVASTGAAAVAIGGATDSAVNAAQASGWGSVALGYKASAAGNSAVALGQATATADNTVALGAGSLADRTNTVSVGKSGAERQVVNVAKGTQNTDAVNVQQLKDAGLTTDTSGVATNSFVAYDDMTKGKITLAGGTNGTTITNLKAGSAATDAVNVQQLTNATRYFKAGGANDGTDDATITGSGIAAGLKASADANGVAIGVGAIASNVSGGTYASVAIGRGTSATGGNATAVGDKANAVAGGTAVGDNASAKVARAVAIGEGAGASNESSIAVGTRSTVSGDYATALGVQATSTQNSAVALGANAASTGVSAVAIGGSWSSAANAAQASGTGSVALGYKASAAGNSAVALGQATATADNTVALGAGSVADRTNTVSVGKSGAERQVVNVAKGTQNTDAVNVQQLKDAGLTTDTSGVATNSFVAYDDTTKGKITLGGGTNGTTITNLKAGSIAAGSTDAVTGDQLNTTNTNVSSNTTAIAGLDTRVTQNATDIGSLSTSVTANTTNLASAQAQLNVLDGAAVKYDSASKDTITLAGTNGTMISNVKAGVADTDAANLGQLKAAGVVDASGNAASVVAYDSAAKDTVTLAGTNGTTITNLKAGSLAAGSTDAVTGDQLNTTNTNVSSNVAAIAGLDTRVTQNATDIGSLNTSVTANTTNLASAQAQLNALDGAAAKYDSASKDTVTLAGTNGTMISNVKAGVADTDAANVGQLKAAGVVDASGNAAAVVAYDSATKDKVTLAGGTAGTTITNLKAGSLAAGSTDAVTGDQLNTTNTNVSSNTTAIAGLDTRVTQNATNIGGLNTSVTANTTNLASAQAQLNALDGAAAKYNTASKDTLTLAGTTGTTISNVKAGVADTDAVNVSQLKATGLVDASGNAVSGVTYDAGPNKSAVTFAGVGGTQLKNVAAATDDTDAVNLAQLKSSGLVDSHGNALDGLTYDIGSNKGAITLKGTDGTLITNVKAGRLAADSSDAVNGAQLFALAGNTSDSYIEGNGSGVKYARSNDAGLASDDAHAQGVGSTAVGYAATASANDALALGRNAQASFANSVALGAGSATTVGAQANYAAFGLAMPQSSAGEVNVGNRQITGVAAGSADQDAVNVAQLKSVDAKVDGVSAAVAQADKNALKYDDALQAKVTLGGAGQAHAPVTIANVANGTVSADSTEAVNGSQLFDLQNAVVNSAANAAQVASIVAVGDTAAGDVAQASGTHAVAVGANTSASGNNSAALGANATASANNSTAIGTGATASHDNAVAIGANSTTDRENSVSVGSVGGERQITNVAAGTQANDAVNLSQMQGAVAGGVAAANAYADARFNQAKRDAYAGTAAAMAIAGLPQATLPGRGMMAVAGSTYHGESAVAMGVSAISESGRFAVKVTGSTNGHGDYGVTAGAGVHW
jgi:trimeric autotransporter adhesin